jgi:phenylpyruvate tautomerase PptA (4-oxalocrotonate tautomerase family)
MPMAIVRVVEGVLDDTGKKQLIEKVADALVEVGRARATKPSVRTFG